MDVICEDERGKRALTERITARDGGHEIVTGSVHDEVDEASKLQTWFDFEAKKTSIWSI
jgi:hypothetical protein